MAADFIRLTMLPIANMLRLYIKKVSGVENVPLSGSYIVAANHASYMDHLIIQSIATRRLKRVVYFLAKKEHFQGIIQNAWHRYVGAIPIDREKGGKKALETASRFLKKGKIIGIYPEGTRTLNGKLQPAKTGVARLALKARVPVVPIGLIGTFNILPKGKFIPRCKRAIVNIGKPLFFEEYYGKENNKKILRLVTNKIMRQIAKLAKQRHDFR